VRRESRAGKRSLSDGVRKVVPGFRGQIRDGRLEYFREPWIKKELVALVESQQPARHQVIR
jgi:hypothetical protein